MRFFEGIGGMFHRKGGHERGRAVMELKATPSREPDRNQQIRFVEQILERKGEAFKNEFEKRLAELKPDLPETQIKSDTDYKSPAMHSVEQKYNLLRKMLEEETGQSAEDSPKSDNNDKANQPPASEAA